MRLPRSWSLLALLCLSCLQFSSPTKSHADTYSIVANWAENHWGFDGIDASGNVYLNNFSAYADIETEIVSPTGSSVIISSALPLTFVSDRGGFCRESLPGYPRVLNGLCNGPLFSFLYADDGGPDTNLYVYRGMGDPQLVTSAHSGDLLGMDSFGDIVFDNGFVDEAYYAVDLTSHATPEPSSLMLLATGLAGAAFLLLRRRALA